MNELSAKPWYKSKVLWLAALQALAGIVMVFGQAHPDLGWIMILKSIVDSALRYVTTKPIY